MTEQLFSGAEPARPPCFMNEAARKKLGQDEGWRWCKAEVIGDDMLLEGAHPNIISKGKRKGQATWKGIALTKVVLTRADIDQAEADYEARTCCCRKCGGSGQEWCRWHFEEGNSYRTCTRCGGSGKPAEVKQ